MPTAPLRRKSSGGPGSWTDCLEFQRQSRRLTCQVFFFFQAEDGIRDYKVTGVQTCALPIYPATFPALLDWEAGPMVHLHWCRVHDGEFGQLRRSGEGVALAAPPVKPGPPTLELEGRVADSLVFAIDDGIVPAFEGGSGFGWPPPYAGWTPASGIPASGWRYDLAVDDATLLPLVVTPTAPA